MPATMPNFTTLKRWILDAASESDVEMSGRQAKKLAGDYLIQNDPESYMRITHRDPVGEGVASRWIKFQHDPEWTDE